LAEEYLPPTSFYPNPYDILDLTPAAAKAEIAKALATAMKRKQHSLNQIAAAQKLLSNPRTRLQADFLRPILPAIVRFKRPDLRVLAQPLPVLELLPEFDGLEAEIAAAAEESRPLAVNCAPQPPEPIFEETSRIAPGDLFARGVERCQEGNYLAGIEMLEEFSRHCQSRDSKEYIQAQIWLVKAYYTTENISQARALCQYLANSENLQLRTWAARVLANLNRS